MSYLLEKAFQLTIMVIFMLAFFILIFIAFMLMTRMKRKGKKEEDNYYQQLDRYDAQDYLDFEDITDGMVVTDGHRRFVGAIKCIGYDFYSASGTQQLSTMDGFRGFLRTITTPVTYMQYFVRMRMDHTQSMYLERYEQVEKELFHKEEDRKIVVGQLNLIKGTDIVMEEALLTRIEELQEEISNLSWRREHLAEQMNFMKLVSDKSVMEPDMEQIYLFEWSFVASDYSIEFTEEEIHKKAITELNGLAGRLISALANANVRAYRCGTEELIEMFQHQSHPLSAMEFTMPDVINSPFFDFVATTNDIGKRRKEVYDDLMLEESARMMREFEANLLKLKEGGEEE